MEKFKKREFSDFMHSPAKSHRQEIIEFIKLNKLAYHDEFSGKYYIDVNKLEPLNEYNKEDLRSIIEKHLYKIGRDGNKIAMPVRDDNLKSGLAGGSIRFNYIKQILDKLPKWKTGDTDYIDLLASNVVLEDESEREWFKTILTKWLVASIGQMTGTGKNELVFILSGGQGNGKTKFFENLFKPFDGLWISKNIDTKKKDDLLALTENVFNIWDEMETMRKAESNDLKHLVSTQDISERRPYASMNGNYRKVCSFAGCTNDPNVLKDETGSRRFHIFKTLTINYNNDVDKYRLFAQARYLYNDGYMYWLDFDDLEKTNERGRDYIQSNPMLDAYLSAKKQSPVVMEEWLNVAEIITRVNLLTGLKIPLNSLNSNQMRLALRTVGLEEKRMGKGVVFAVSLKVREMNGGNWVEDTASGDPF